MRGVRYEDRDPAKMLTWMRNHDLWSPECCEASSSSRLLALLGEPHGGFSGAWTCEDCMRASRQDFHSLLAELKDNDWNALRPVASSRLLQLDCQAEVERFLHSTPHLCACIAARGQLDVLQWLFHWPKHQQHAAAALQAAANHNQLHVVQFLLGTGLKPHATMNLDQVKLPCMFLLARAGCPMRERYPHRVAEVVEPWYVFVGLVRWAAQAGKDENRASPPHKRSQAPDHDLLRQLAGLSSDLVMKIASDALVSPTEAKRIQ